MSYHKKQKKVERGISDVIVDYTRNLIICRVCEKASPLGMKEEGFNAQQITLDFKVKHQACTIRSGIHRKGGLKKRRIV